MAMSFNSGRITSFFRDAAMVPINRIKKSEMAAAIGDMVIMPFSLLREAHRIGLKKEAAVPALTLAFSVAAGIVFFPLVPAVAITGVWLMLRSKNLETRKTLLPFMTRHEAAGECSSCPAALAGLAPTSSKPS